MESSSHQLIGPMRLINRIEYIRLIMQAISSLGYQNSTTALEMESCISYKSQEFHKIESSILKGHWDECIDTLKSIQDWGGETLNSAIYLVARQRFVEHINGKEMLSAIAILQDEMSSLNLELDKVKRLAMALVTEEIEEIGFKKGCNIQDLRKNLVKHLNNLLPLQISFPRSRSLEAIIEDSILSSFEKCMYHNSCDEVSLYEYHTCYSSENQIPAKTIQVLTEHTKEVWMIKFSNGGDFLASTSDDVIFIWKVNEYKLYKQHTFQSNDQIDCIAWSTDDSLLLVVGMIGAQIWRLKDTPYLLWEEDKVENGAWLPNLKKIVYSKSGQGIYLFDTEGKMQNGQLERELNMVDFIAFTPNGKVCIYVLHLKEIMIHNIANRNEKVKMEELIITSLSVSDNNFFIVCVKSEIHMWDVAGKWHVPRVFVGHKQEDIGLTACTGGWNSRFIAIGSEDSQVYIWNGSQPSEPITILSGHSKAVNCVSWNPKRPQMMASCSDDFTIRIWGPDSKRKTKLD